MKPVRQTNFEKYTGDCWSACIASILEIPLADVPNFCHKDNDRFWLKRTIDWLAEKGYGVVHMQQAHEAMEKHPHLFVRCFCIVSGRSPRAPEGDDDWMHAVVGTCEMDETEDGYRSRIEYIHDPHPSGKFITGDPVEITILVRILP